MDRDKIQPLFWPGTLSFLVIAAITILALQFSDHTTEIAPDRTGNAVGIAGLVALVATGTAYALVGWLRPAFRGASLLGTLILPLVFGFMVGLVTFSAAGRIFESLDFSRGTIRLQQNLPITRAYIAHGKGVSYHIQIGGQLNPPVETQSTELFADFDLHPDDYHQVFGKNEDVRPAGYCLKAPLEKSGNAIRIMFSEARAIPEGLVIRCG